MKRWIASALVLVSTFAPVTIASSAEDPCEGSRVTTVETGEHTYYIDVRSEDNGVWTYEESNGLAGLQRGGEAELAPGLEYDDLCVDESGENGPDTLIV